MTVADESPFSPFLPSLVCASGSITLTTAAEAQHPTQIVGRQVCRVADHPAVPNPECQPYLFSQAAMVDHRQLNSGPVEEVRQKRGLRVKTQSHTVAQGVFPQKSPRPSSSFLILLSFSCVAATLWLHPFSFPLVTTLFFVLLFTSYPGIRIIPSRLPPLGMISTTIPLLHS